MMIRSALRLVLLLILFVPSSAVSEVKPLKVVLIGDSYAAGTGSRDADGDRNYQGPEGCRRSPTNWASQYVDWLGDQGYQVTFVNRACHGGEIEHITNQRDVVDGGLSLVLVDSPPDTPQDEVVALAETRYCPMRHPGDEFYTPEYEYYYGSNQHVVTCNRFLRPQINAIGEDTDLVLVMIGGNDVDFAGIVTECFVSGPRDPRGCREQVGSANEGLDTLEDELFELLKSIRSTARPDTKVALIGYPLLAHNDNFQLVSQVSIAGVRVETDRYAAAREVRNLGRSGDVSQQAAVDRANAEASEPFSMYVRFVDEVKARFAGREPGQVQGDLGEGEGGTSNENRWMYQASLFDSRQYREWYHPDDEGQTQLGLLMRQFETFGAIGMGAGTSAALDLAFVIDTTGSMGNDIAAVKASANAIIDQLELGAQSFRVAVVDYRDFPERTGTAADYPAKLQLDFTSNPTAIRAAINGLTLGYGGDFLETIWSGLFATFALDWRPGVKKVAIQFGDAGPLNPEPFTGYTGQDVITRSLEIDPVAIYAVDTGSSGSSIPEVAEATGGQVLTAPTPGQVAETIQEVIDTALAAPYAWVGTGYAGYTGKAITFNGSGSYDSDGEIVGYEWDVDGDGVYESSTLEPQLVHTYLADYAGIVTMRVTDDTGRVGLATAPVDVSIDGDSIPEADDNCPLDHNPSQEDEDGDGFGDLCDLDYEYATEEAEGVGIAIGPPPFATILDGPYEGSICEPTPISGEVGDPEGDAVTPLWIPSEGCSIADPGALATTIACPEEGNYILYLTADDGNGGVVADETSVTVEPDTTPPEVTAALNAKGKVEEDEGKFRVAFSCSDTCDTAPSARATLNGIPVPNGQLVKLEIDNHSEVKFGRRILKLEAPAFTLEVECEDSAGNLSTATAAPAFRSDDDDDRGRRQGRRHRRQGGGG